MQQQGQNIESERQQSICEGYYIDKTIGKGAQGKVKLGQSGLDIVAFKFLSFKNEQEKLKQIEQLHKEAKILRKLRYENIIKLIHYSDKLNYMKKKGGSIEKIGLILECGKNGDVLSYLQHFQKFDEPIVRFYFLQILNALIYMKNHNICHRDLKLDNFVFDDQYNFKIIDFGFATEYSGLINNFYGGTGPYIAPELWEGKEYDGQKVDVFAVGQVLFSMMTGQYAFNKSNTEHYYSYFKENNHQEFWIKFENQLNRTFSDNFKDLINKMFEYDFNQRISLEECIQHQWLSGQIADLKDIQELFKHQKQIIDLKNDQNLERQRKYRQIQKEKEAIRRMGNTNGDRGDEEQTKSQELKKKIQKKYKFNFENRVLKKSRPTQMFNEILTCQEKESLFVKLIKIVSHISINITIHKNKFKFYADICDDNDKAKYKIQIELCDIGDEILRVDVLNLGNDFIDFNQQLDIIRQKLEEIEESSQS